MLCILFLSSIIWSAGFPTIRTKALSNEWVELPIKEVVQLYVIGFDQESGKHMADWVRGLELRPTSNITWYQLPVIGGVPPFVDGFIVNGMKKSILEKMHGTVLPYFGNRYKVMDVLIEGSGLEDEVAPFIVILDEDTQVTLNIQGYATTKNIQIVNQKLQAFQ